MSGTGKENRGKTERPAKPDIWMPLYIGDYLADTAHLDAERSGCYLHWLMHYWRKGPLPTSIPALIQIGKLCSEDAPSIAQALLDDFFEIQSDGKYHQRRIDEELQLATGKKLKATAKASKAARARWGRNASSDAPSIPSSIDRAMLESCPLPSPSPSENKEMKHAADAASVSVHDFVSAWNEHSGSLPKVRDITDGRRKKVKSRLAQGLTLERFAEAVDRCAVTPFTSGENRQGWTATFDWLVENDTNVVAVLEGKYDSAKPAMKTDAPRPVSTEQFAARTAREDQEELESYMTWSGMSDSYKREFPWTGKRFYKLMPKESVAVA